ncbi:MAG TPA: phage terminase large subunit, partial [Methanocorpusculum sp.]|nr:phage terminase large subunit [Methanocorpusculum sp.]
LLNRLPRSDLNHPCKIILTWNPILKTKWVYNRFFINKEPDCLICHSNYLDNYYCLNEKYIEILESTKINNPSRWIVYGLGKWE